MIPNIIIIVPFNSDKEIDNTLKYSGVFNINKSMWGKLQLTYSVDETNESKSRAFGFDT